MTVGKREYESETDPVSSSEELAASPTECAASPAKRPVGVGGHSASPGEPPVEEAARQAVAEAAHLASIPDSFQRLWTPHRMAYVAQGQSKPSEQECPFCEAPQRDDTDTLIVHRGRHAYALLNLFPYNSGHLLVCPYRHISLYDEADAEETREIAHITQTAMRVIREVAGCDGFNIGMNQGAIAGAGIASHLHQHLVPRWAGDANFLPIIAGTKALPQLLGQMREQIAGAWPVQA